MSCVILNIKLNKERSYENGLSVLLAGVMHTSLFGCSSNEPKEQVNLQLRQPQVWKTHLKMN